MRVAGSAYHFINPRYEQEKLTTTGRESKHLLSDIKECTRSRNVKRGLELHEQAIQRGLSHSTHVLNSLINMYSKCGCMPQARSIFDKMVHRDVISWNTLLQGYAENGQSELALQLYFSCGDGGQDARTYVAAVKACTNLALEQDSNRLVWLEKGREIHARAVSGGCCDVFVECSLIGMYSKCGCMSSARTVFDKMRYQNVVAWNTLLQGYADNGENELVLELFERMKHECVPNARSYIAPLQACAALFFSSSGNTGGLKWLRKGREIHARAATSGCCDVFVECVLVDMYAKCQSMEEARSVFGKMVQPNVVSFTSLLRGYVDNGECKVAIELFDAADMKLVNSRTYVVVLTACAVLAAAAVTQRTKWLEKTRVIHSQALAAGFLDVFVESMLIDVYAKCGCMPEARRVFEGMGNRRNAVAWTAFLQGYVDNGESEVALELFQGMEDCVLSARAYVVAFTACAALGEKSSVKTIILRQRAAKAIHSTAVRKNFWCVFVKTAAVNMYTKCQSMGNARLVFDAMEEPSAVTWNCLVQGYVDSGDNQAALDLIQCMGESGIVKNSATFVAALMACSNLIAFDVGRRFHAEIRGSGLHEDVKVATCLVEFYGRCGNVEAAREVFNAIPVKDVHAWNALMSVYSQKGETSQVFGLLERMREQGLAPTGISCSHVLTACSHAGEVDKGRAFFEAMRSEYGIQPDVMHCNCVVDMLGRSNRVEEALRFVRDLPCQADTVIWSTLLGACEKWNNGVVGEVAYKASVSGHGAAYVLMSNILSQNEQSSN